MTSVNLLCRSCHSPIDPRKRADSVFCGTQCRADYNKQRLREANRQRKEYEESVLVRHAAWLHGFRRELESHAPEMAIGYRVGLWTGRMFLWLPIVPSGGTRLTLNRQRTSDDFFLLDPFEPPKVPRATTYEIRFASRLYPHIDLEEQGRFHAIIPYEIKQTLPLEDVSSLPMSRRKQ